MEQINKIKLKINALLSKTIENGATKQEMESALAKATQLMTEYFITSHDLKDIELKNKCILTTAVRIKSKYDLSRFYVYLASLFDCEHYYTNSNVSFFGHEQDANLCAYFSAYIERTCLSEKDRFLNSTEYQSLKKYNHGKTLSSSFIKGFIVEVSDKLLKMYIEKTSNIPQSYGLMVVEKKEKVGNEFKALGINIKTVKNKKLYGDQSAFAIGKEQGAKLKLVQGVETSQTQSISNF